MQNSTYSRQRLVRDARLTGEDVKYVAQCRRDHNRLGCAYQLAFVKLFNRFPAQNPLELDEELLTFVALQLEIDADLISDYAARQPTVSKHQEKLREHLGRRTLGAAESSRLERFLFEESCRLEQTAQLRARAEEFLREGRILQPADSTLARMVGAQRQRAREDIFQRVTGCLPPDVLAALDGLLDVEPGKNASRLQTIKENPRKPSPDAMLALIDRLSAIEDTGILAIDLSWLNGNYQRALYHYVRKSWVDRLKRAAPIRRYAALACFLCHSYRDTVDQLIDMFDKLLTRVHARAKREFDDRLKDHRRTITTSLATLKSVGAILLDESVEDAHLRAAIFRVVPRDELSMRLDGISAWISGKNSDVFHTVMQRFSYLRRFAPSLLNALSFAQDTQDAPGPCMQAVELLRQLNDANKRALPEDAPTAFIPDRLRHVVENEGKIDKRGWECTLLFRLRDEIKAGNVFVCHSKRFGRFDDYFIADTQWEARKAGFFERGGLPQNPLDVPQHLCQRLNQAYDLFLLTAPDNSFATVDRDGWHLASDSTAPLNADSQNSLQQLHSWLGKHMRRIKLPELLIEVDNTLNFTRHFRGTSTNGVRSADDVCITLAAVMAHGCNIGPYTMAQLTPDISYRQLKRVSDWHMTQETQREALATLVHAISRLDATLQWGEGRTSASDGQRFALPKKVLQRTYSTRFSDFALEFYTFVADNYAPFYSTPIECTDRDAAFVLDGLLYNESDLELEEHYTDTHGYTEINFAAFAMLGRRFCPRIKGIQKQRIYRVDKDRDYGPLTHLVSRADRTIDTTVIAEQWDRMGQFYSSLESGHTTASVALKRLVAYSAKNRFYRANRELGRVLKTEFILGYMSEPDLRARIRRGLLKVEQLHSLARDVYYARRGRINARELHEQMNSCSCLTLILACIIYWQAREITRVIRQFQPERSGVDVSLLEHISPIEWENVILYGQYVIDRNLIR